MTNEFLEIPFIQIVLEIQRFKSVKACRPKARQAKVNANSSTNSLNCSHFNLRFTFAVTAHEILEAYSFKDRSYEIDLL
ncbi:MAG: hypothetical protein LBP59_01105 [Planctomycetaceae bacterium]|nr:hypothetical protein [Planctomycetaceae bacterium]